MVGFWGGGGEGKGSAGEQVHPLWLGLCVWCVCVGWGVEEGGGGGERDHKERSSRWIQLCEFVGGGGEVGWGGGGWGEPETNTTLDQNLDQTLHQTL